MSQGKHIEMRILHSWLINVTSTKYVNLLLLRGNVKEEVLLFMYRVIYL